MQDGEEGHFKADERVLNGRGQVVRAVAGNAVWDGAEPDEDREEKALPVRGEDDALDTYKLWHRPERFEVAVHADPEHGEGVERDCNADIVDDAAP